MLAPDGSLINIKEPSHSITSIIFMLVAVVVIKYAVKITKMLADNVMYIFVVVFIIMTGSLAFIVFFTESGGVFSTWLGVRDIYKKTTIELIAYGIIGILAAVNAVVINRRARAQEDNNKMVEQGNKDYRFQNLVNNLGHEKTTVRVATFYRFYYLASKEKNNREESKEKKNRMVEKDVFEMLCSCLRVMFIEELDNKTTPDEQQMARQTLFDILFKGKFKSNDDMKSGLVHDEVKADLRNVCFTDIDFSDANLSEVDFRKAEFNNVNLDKIHSVKGADFRGAKILGMPIKRDDIPDNKGEYYANWNPPPEK